MAERLSRHGAERAAQRNISPEDMDFVLQYGQEIHRSGAIFVFLGRRDIPESMARRSRADRLVGTTILLSSDEECVITAYRNRKALREIKRKDKRYIQKAA